MLKRNLAVVLCALLLTPLFGLQAATAQNVSESALRAEQAKIKVAKIGTGQSARVEVKLRDNTKLKGYISEAGSDSFTVTDRKTGASQAVAYTDVTNVKKQGGGLSSRTKWIITGAALTAGAIVLYTVRGAFCDGQC